MSEVSRNKRMQIEEFSIWGDDDENPLHYRAEDFRHSEGGEQHASVLVRLDVDGQSDVITADLENSNDLRVLNRTIEALTVVRDRLEQMYPAGAPRDGRCMGRGDWGRCKLRDGHEEEQRAAGCDVGHLFPTEEEYCREQEFLNRLRSTRGDQRSA